MHSEWLSHPIFVMGFFLAFFRRLPQQQFFPSSSSSDILLCAKKNLCCFWINKTRRGKLASSEWENEKKIFCIILVKSKEPTHTKSAKASYSSSILYLHSHNPPALDCVRRILSKTTNNNKSNGWRWWEFMARWKFPFQGLFLAAMAREERTKRE